MGGLPHPLAVTLSAVEATSATADGLSSDGRFEKFGQQKPHAQTTHGRTHTRTVSLIFSHFGRRFLFLFISFFLTDEQRFERKKKKKKKEKRVSQRGKTRGSCFSVSFSLLDPSRLPIDDCHDDDDDDDDVQCVQQQIDVFHDTIRSKENAHIKRRWLVPCPVTR